MRSYTDEEILKFSGKLTPVERTVELPDKTIELLREIVQKLDGNSRDIISLSKVDIIRRIGDIIRQVSVDQKINTMKEISRITSQLTEIVELMNKPIPETSWTLSVQRDKNGLIETVIAEKQ